jgi:methionine synthase II (cobalamin-independent)
VQGGNATHGGRDSLIESMPFGIGTPTAVGSLPFVDADEAITFVLDALPELPAAPTLPRRDPREGMIAQAAWGISGVTVCPDGTIEVAPMALDPEAPLGDPGLDGAPFATLRRFLVAVAGRTEPIKVQLTGPVTLASALARAGADPAIACAVAVTAVRARARAVVDAVTAVAPEATVVAFLDEPALVGGPPVELADPETVIDLVSGALAVLEPRAITGVHVCGPSDWKAVLQAGPRILSAPVGAGFGPSAGALATFLERDGWIAWGAVPTDRPLGESASHWWRDLSAQWCSLVQAGCDPVRIRRQALVTPACGLALHDVAQVDLVHDLTRTLGLRIHDQLAGVRLSVGA